MPHTNYQNFTKFNNNNLRLLFSKCLQIVEKDLGYSEVLWLDIIFQETIKIKYGYGLAYPIGVWSYIRIHLPCQWYLGKENKNKLTQLIIHECYHICDMSLSEKQVEKKTMSHNLQWSNAFNLKL